MAEKRIEPGPLAKQVARAIRRVREDQRITYAELAERLAEAGRPIPVLGLSRMEKGDRRIDLDDLVAIARALRVPPVWLMFPVGRPDASQVELLPGVRIPTEAACAWFIGDAEAFDDYFGHGNYDADSRLYEWYEIPEALREGWGAEATPLTLHRRHQRLVSDWHAAVPTARRLASDEKSFGEILFKLHGVSEEDLRTVRAEMRRHGLISPQLPPTLAQVLADTGRVLYERVEGGQVVERVNAIKDGHEDLRLSASPSWRRVDEFTQTDGEE